ncbi:hypothetical protein [Rhodopila sp.]|uniref:hypothetical protein n=1 Tax=Rhodopila sp. TaxID=2480087 RepID=UPI003D0F2473
MARQLCAHFGLAVASADILVADISVSGVHFVHISWKTKPLTDTQGLEVIVSASHLFEPIAHVLILSDNTDKDAELDPNPVPFVGGFKPDVTLTNGIKTNAFSYAPMTGGGVSSKTN